MRPQDVQNLWFFYSSLNSASARFKYLLGEKQRSDPVPSSLKIMEAVLTIAYRLAKLRLAKTGSSFSKVWHCTPTKAMQTQSPWPCQDEETVNDLPLKLFLILSLNYPFTNAF